MACRFSPRWHTSSLAAPPPLRALSVCLSDIRISDNPRLSEDFLTVSGFTWTTHTSYLYLPDGKMATIRFTRIALEPAGYTH